jgi:DNA-binding response OmpR family regulator
MRVLLVEDYAPLRKAVAQGLREAGFAVDATGDGAEGLWYAQGSDYDAIVLDLMLPGMDGLTILRRLREAGRKAHVLILTAKGTLADRVQGLNLGADDYLVKPFAFEELLARVRALVRRRHDVGDPVLRVADLEVDTVGRVARRAGERIELSAREYALLELLALRAGEVVTRADIWEHLYEFDSAAQSNVVDVYIGYLRRKIERPGLPCLIHTRRGQGYVLGESP